jgi:hypothetical protein
MGPNSYTTYSSDVVMDQVAVTFRSVLAVIKAVDMSQKTGALPIAIYSFSGMCLGDVCIIMLTENSRHGKLRFCVTISGTLSLVCSESSTGRESVDELLVRSAVELTMRRSLQR